MVPGARSERPKAPETQTQKLWRDARAILGDAKKEDRLKQVILVRLRGTATDEQFRSVLMRVADQNGLGLTKEKTDALVALVQTDPRVQRGARNEGRGTGTTEPQKATAPAVAPKPPARHPTQPPLKEVRRVPSPAVISEQVSPNSQRPEVLDSKLEVRSQKPVARSREAETTPTHLRGPVDELAMTLDEWRRLGNAPSMRAGEVIERIGTLAKEEYRKRIDGIEAWKKSAVVRAYQGVARRAYEAGTSIADAIKNQSDITEDEFVTIARLNAALRY